MNIEKQILTNGEESWPPRIVRMHLKNSMASIKNDSDDMHHK